MSAAVATTTATVVVPESFSESHLWTTKLRSCFCGDLAVLPDEDPAYFNAFPDVSAFRKAMRDQSNPKSHGARVYLTHRFIVHKLRTLASMQLPVQDPAFSDAQTKASQSIAELMGDISFLVDSDNPGVFASVYVENFVKAFSSTLPIVVSNIVGILELDRLTAEDDDINNVLKYSPQVVTPEQPAETEQKTEVSCPKAKSSADLLLAMRQNAKSVGQFSKALRDPGLAFRQISLPMHCKKQQEIPSSNPTITAEKKECSGEKQKQKALVVKRKRRW